MASVANYGSNCKKMSFGEVSVIISYATIVAVKVKGIWYTRHTKWSRTSTRHIQKATDSLIVWDDDKYEEAMKVLKHEERKVSPKGLSVKLGTQKTGGGKLGRVKDILM